MPVYVQREVIGKVSDVFNAETIWQAPGLALFSRRPLLRDLLERSPREQRGHAPTRCFSHVTLLLAQDEVDDDRHLTRGARVRDLAESLTALHRKDFGDLLGSDEVRYQVIGTEALEPGQVQIKFGHAVYLPASAELPQYSVETSSDSAIWHSVCPIYPGQRLALIGHDAEHASHAVPDWPFGSTGAILLVNDGPGTPIEVQVRPKGAFECTLDAASGYYSITAKGSAARLLMKVSPAGATAKETPKVASNVTPNVAPVAASVAAAVAAAVAAPVTASFPAPAAKPVSVWKARAPSLDDGATAVPFSQRPVAVTNEATFCPVAAPATLPSTHQVSLVALALPRLSRYRETGAVALHIGLDHNLAVCAAGVDPVITFAVDDSDTIEAITAAGRRPVCAPQSFTPVDATRVELLPVAPEMNERYCALLRLAHGVQADVASGARFVFGRCAPMLAPLRLLDASRFLRRAEGADQASADRIGLSRSAFSFEAADGGYQIGRLSPTQALYHLDAQLAFVAVIGAATLDQPYLLPAGHHLVAGHYVMRFDA